MMDIPFWNTLRTQLYEESVTESIDHHYRSSEMILIAQQGIVGCVKKCNSKRGN